MEADTYAHSVSMGRRHHSILSQVIITRAENHDSLTELKQVNYCDTLRRMQEIASRKPSLLLHIRRKAHGRYQTHGRCFKLGPDSRSSAAVAVC